MNNYLLAFTKKKTTRVNSNPHLNSRDGKQDSGARKRVSKVRGGKRGQTHTWMEILNPSTSAKPVITKLQAVFVALVNMDIFQMTFKFSLFIV